MRQSKILIVNKYHFISGGAERYFFNVMEAFRKRGIEPIPFSVNYSRTLPTPYQKYFISPVVPNGDAKIQKMHPTLAQQMAIAGRAIYNLDAKRAIHQIWQDHRPDAAYFLNFNNHISPSAIDACAEVGLPVVMRMSDFNLSCPANMYFRKGKSCTDCTRGLHHAVIHRCIHGSFIRSATQVFANTVHRWMKVYRKVSAFVAPTEFMRQDLIALGFPPEKIYRVNTFRKLCLSQELPDDQSPYILYVGRFVRYKGVEMAVRAFAKTKGNIRLKLVGDENDRESEHLKSVAQELGETRIDFLSFERDADKLHDLIHRSLFTMVPSLIYDNLPNTILESFACGRPVIATRLGSLPDIVIDGKLGLLFDYRSVDDFSAKIQWLMDHPAEREAMGRNAYEAIQEDYSEDTHMDKVISIFDQACNHSAQQLVSV